MAIANYTEAVAQYEAAGGTGTPDEDLCHANNGRKTWVLRSTKFVGGLLAYCYQTGGTSDHAYRDMVAP